MGRMVMERARIAYQREYGYNLSLSDKGHAMAEKVLIIEDNLALRQLVSSELRAENYDVVATEDGRSGLEAARAGDPPQLILLDVALPGELSGFQVCQMLQNEPDTADIPVIFLTAHSTLDDKLTGFAVGGIDYLPKPFTMPELLARVKANLRRQAGEQRRTKRAIDTYKKHLSQNVTHELRTPLAKLRIALGLLAQELPRASRDDLQEILEHARTGAEELETLIEDVLLVNKLTNSDPRLSYEPISLSLSIEWAWNQARTKYGGKGLVLQDNVANDTTVYINRDHILAILKHLVGNACKFSPAGGQIVLAAEPIAGGGVVLDLHNDGVTIPPALHDDIFEKFFQADMSTTRPRDGLGIGLYLARTLARAYGGDVTLVKSDPQAGTLFRLYLPPPPHRGKG